MIPWEPRSHKNLFLSFLLTQWDNLPRIRKRANMNDPRDIVVSTKPNDNLLAKNAKPYRRPARVTTNLITCPRMTFSLVILTKRIIFLSGGQWP